MVSDSLRETLELTRNNTGMALALALNYSGRAEIVDAARAIAQAHKEGRLRLEDIDETCISEHLYTAGLADPDLLIRTASELRVSNFLLWQISYSEFYVTDTLWPEFDERSLEEAFLAYARRDRRFGAIDAAAPGRGQAGQNAEILNRAGVGAGILIGRRMELSHPADMLKHRLLFGTLMTILLAGLVLFDGWLDGSLTASTCRQPPCSGDAADGSACRAPEPRGHRAFPAGCRQRTRRAQSRRRDRTGSGRHDLVLASVHPYLPGYVSSPGPGIRCWRPCSCSSISSLATTARWPTAASVVSRCCISVFWGPSCSGYALTKGPGRS